MIPTNPIDKKLKFIENADMNTHSAIIEFNTISSTYRFCEELPSEIEIVESSYKSDGGAWCLLSLPDKKLESLKTLCKDQKCFVWETQNFDIFKPLFGLTPQKVEKALLTLESQSVCQNIEVSYSLMQKYKLTPLEINLSRTGSSHSSFFSLDDLSQKSKLINELKELNLKDFHLADAKNSLVQRNFQDAL